MYENHYDQLGEKVYSHRLANGLEVYVVPKSDFKKTYAMFSTKYGSIDELFQIGNKPEFQSSDGVAHFLEHKMFEQPNGEDVHQVFASQGASSNAFTSSTQTSYLFSCTDKVDDNLLTLIDYVQEPYFTDENVDKEKGIIAQELEMYQDDPGWRVYSGLLEALYHFHPVRIDIGGTMDSINGITKEELYTCYRTFYHPSNMVLCIVGPVDPVHTINLVYYNQLQKQFPAQGKIRRIMKREPDSVKEELRELQLSVGLPKCLIGCKEKRAHLFKTGEDYVHQELATDILVDILFGDGSPLYQDLYKEGLVDKSFSASYSLENTYGFSIIGGNTPKPYDFIERIKYEIPAIVARGIDEGDFERIRRKHLGGIIYGLNSQRSIASKFISYRFNNADLFTLVPIIENLTIDDINNRLQEHFDSAAMASSVVMPLDE